MQKFGWIVLLAALAKIAVLIFLFRAIWLPIELRVILISIVLAQLLLSKWFFKRKRRV